MTSGQAISKLKHDKKYSNEVIEPLEKEHKALETIKKNVNVNQLLMAVEMNGVFGSELKLLKEVLL